FALAPVASGLPGKHAAEAVASFVRPGAFGTAAASNRAGTMDAGVDSWRKAYETEQKLAGMLEEWLKAGFSGSSLADRVGAFVRSLPEGDSLEAAPNGANFTLGSAADPFPRLLAGLLGVSGKGGEEAIPVLAAL